MRTFLKILLFLTICTSGLAQTMTNSTATNAPVTATTYVMDDTHVLEPGDVISFQIVEDDDPATNLVVTDSTELNAPYVGRVSVSGKTCRSLAVQLKTLLEKTYYYRATVIVGLDSVNKVRGQAFITGGSGAIRNGGAVDIIFNKKLTAGEAILLLGGFGDFADKKHVQVLRKQGTNNVQSQTFVINMEDAQNGKNDDIVLEPGDLVYVPARLVNF